MSNYNFDKDLLRSKNTELEIADILKNQHPGIQNIDFLNNNKGDLQIHLIDGIITIEIKEDLMAAKTGNVAVEYECRGKLSGISVTKAEVIIYKIHNSDKSITYFLIKTDELKKSIKNKWYDRTVTGGDVGSNTKMYLYKYNKFKELGKIFFHKEKC